MNEEEIVRRVLAGFTSAEAASFEVVEDVVGFLPSAGGAGVQSPGRFGEVVGWDHGGIGVNIQPDRHNWRQFCQEEELIDEEWADWRRMAREITQDDALYDFVSQHTLKEYEAELEAGSQPGWAGLVAQADARRRLMKAELKAWREYHQKITVPTRV